MRRVLPLLGFTVLAFGVIVWHGDARAQDETITNAEELVADSIDQPGLCYPLVGPTEAPLSWQALGIFWADFSQLTNALGDVRNFEGDTQYGISVWRLRLTRTADGTVFSYPAANTNLLQLAASGDDGFSNHYQHVLWEWTILGAVRNYESYEDLLADGFTVLAPKRLVLDITLGDVNDCATYEDNAGGGMFMTMSEEGDDLTPGFGIDGDPCSITNLLQPFSITSIQRTNAATTITWESCPIFRYRVLSADALSVNTTWLSQSNTSYIWGQPGASATSWTDLSTTNTAITQRFYKVEKLLGNQIAGGGLYSLALRPDGALWTWGAGDDGELGDQTYGDPFPFYASPDSIVEYVRPFPVEVADPTSCVGQTITNAAAVAGGGEAFSVVVDATGRVWTWGGSFGDEDEGAPPVLGDGGLRVLNQDGDLLVPSPISGVSNIVSVAAGYEHTLALRADGTVWAWGRGDSGQLGVPSLDPTCHCTNAPAQSSVLTQIVAIAAGANHSLALDMNGRVWTFGNGGAGQLGNGGTTNLAVPAMLTTISNVIAIAGGFDHTLALTADKTVWTWGTNSQGQLGRSGTSTTPGQVPNLSNVVAIAGGDQFSLAVSSNGQVYAWGDNSNGELGTNTSGGALTSPHVIAGISNAVLVSASVADDSEVLQLRARHSLAMTMDQGANRYWGWGQNDYGQVGNGTNGSGAKQYVPISVQFCTRCQREIQLGTSGSFTAQCTGTLVLYFNDEQGAFSDNAGSFTVTINGVTTNVPGYGNELYVGLSAGVVVGTVTNGGVYPYSASGFCIRDNQGHQSDANGNDTNGTPVSCSSINITNSICPVAKCFSLVGKIQ